jgi:hypothetical protein
VGEVDGLGVDAERCKRWIPAPPRGACSRYLSGAAEPRIFTFPSSSAGPGANPDYRRGRRSAPEWSVERIAAVEAPDRSGAAPELAGSKLAAPEQGSSGRPTKKSQVHTKM